MENTPKKSKALIITIAIIAVLLLAGYLIYQNKDVFGVKTSATIAKIFSPLSPSKNSGQLKTIAQAGEDLKKGDDVSVFGTGTTNNTIVVKTKDGNDIFGTANENIAAGDLGEILSNQKSDSNNFWSSFSSFMENLFTKNTDVDINNGDDSTKIDTFDGYICTKDGVDVSCSSITKIDINSFLCKKDGDIVSCSTLPFIIPEYECKKDDVIVDCTTIDDTDEEKDRALFPLVTMSANPVTIDSGAESTITWGSTNAVSCTLDGTATTAKNGEFKTGILKSPRSYSVTCRNTYGHASKTIVVNIKDYKGTQLLPKVDIVSSPSSVNKGEKSYISWTSKDSISCISDGDTTRGNLTGGFYTENLTSSKSYSVTCKNANGSIADDAFVFVKDHSKYECKKDGVIVDCKDIIDDPDGPGGDEDPDQEKIPDIKANKVSPDTAILNSTTNISSIISNIGNGSTGKEFSSFFEIKGTETNSQILASIVTPTSSIGGGFSAVIRSTYIFNKKQPYLVRACADKSNANDTGIIKESNEENNCTEWTTVTVTDSGSIPTPGRIDTVTECSDEKDNDYDGRIDIEDPNCHIGDDITKEYLPYKISEDESSITTANLEPNKCLLIAQNPLIFTDAEKAKLAEFLRKFYILAPTLKTSEDIALIYKEMDSYKDMITNIDSLTSQCYSQTLSSNGLTKGIVKKDDGTSYTYSGPTERSGNPWYKYSTRNSYIPKYVDATGKVIETKKSEYCTGEFNSKMKAQPSSGKISSCSAAGTEDKCTRHTYKNIFGVDAGFMNTGCTWVGQILSPDGKTTVNLEDYEKILNIW
jgi:hypothetical protein